MYNENDMTTIRIYVSTVKYYDNNTKGKHIFRNCVPFFSQANKKKKTVFKFKIFFF